MMTRHSLKTRLMSLVAAGLALAVVLPVAYSTFTARRRAIQTERKHSLAVAEANAQRISERLNHAMRVARHLAMTFEVSHAANGGEGISRAQGMRILRGTLERNPDLFGTWTCWEPGVFDGQDAAHVHAEGHDATGRFLPYFNRSVGDIRLEPCMAYGDNEEGNEYYVVPRKTKRPYLTSPTVFDTQGGRVMMISFSAPILSSAGDFLGVAGADLSISWVQRFIDEANGAYLQSARFSLVAHDATITACGGRPDVAGKPLSALYPEDHPRVAATLLADRALDFLDDEFLTVRVPMPITGFDRSWQFAIEIPRSVILAAAYADMWRWIGIGAVLLVVSLLAMFWTLRGMFRPLESLLRVTEGIERGDLAQEISLVRSDEIGMLADRFRAMVTKLREVVGQLQGNAEAVVSAGSQLAQTSQVMSEGSSQQAASIEQISSSMEEMASAIAQNADHAQVTERIAEGAASRVMDGKAAVDENLGAMRSIAEEIQVIREISTRTDMLAINAAIEAAKADIHGKGFATVAQQVKSLSEKTQDAARRIEKITAQGIVVAERSGKLLEAVVPEIRHTYQLVQEISAACMEQNMGATQINQAILQINQVVQQNAASSEEVAPPPKPSWSRPARCPGSRAFSNWRPRKPHGIPDCPRRRNGSSRPSWKN